MLGFLLFWRLCNRVCKCSAIVSDRLYFLLPSAKYLPWDSTLSFIIMACFPLWASCSMLEAGWHAQNMLTISLCEGEHHTQKIGSQRLRGCEQPHLHKDFLFAFERKHIWFIKSWSRTRWLLLQIGLRIPGWFGVSYIGFTIFRI